MEKRELAKIKRRVKTLQKRMARLGPVMRGSVVIIRNQKQTKLFLAQYEQKDQVDLSGKKEAGKSKGILRQLQKTSCYR